MRQSILVKERPGTSADIKWVDPKVWKENKASLFRWAKNEAIRKGYKPHVAHLLEIIISCCNMNGISKASVKTFIDKLNQKFPNSPSSRSTIFRHLAILEKGKSIKRGSQQQWNKPCTTTLLAVKSVNTSVSKRNTNNYPLPEGKIAGRDNGVCLEVGPSTSNRFEVQQLHKTPNSALGGPLGVTDGVRSCEQMAANVEANRASIAQALNLLKAGRRQ